MSELPAYLLPLEHGMRNSYIINEYVEIYIALQIFKRSRVKEKKRCFTNYG